jgi:N-acetylmuramoyl-L-alanine amidase
LNARVHALLSTVTVVLLFVAAATLSSQPAASPSITILSRDGRRALPIAMINDQEFVALDDLAPLFQLTVREESFGAITVSYKGRTIILTPDQSLASISGRLISLPAPPSRSGRRWLVPVEFISRALASVYDAPLDFRKPSRLLVLGDLRVPRVTIRYDPLGAASRLTIDVTPRATSTIVQETEALQIKFDADALDVANPPLAPQNTQSLVLGVRLVDPVTLAVQLGPRFASFKATSQPVDTTMRLVIDLMMAGVTTEPAAPATPEPTAPDLPPALGQTPAGVRTIAIDPGHGGEDEGVHGAGGVKEKDIVLAVARRAKAAIEGRLGIRVLLTRDDDRNVPIDERTAIANNSKADLFISLHANASLRKATSGASIYVAAFEKTAAQTAATTGGRVPAFGGGTREIDLVRWDLAQIQFVDQSNTFAGLLERVLRDRVPMAAQTLERAPLRVLESANMPAVLVEMGYLTNAEQEKLLASDAFQGAVVQALFDAVIRFRDSSGGGGGTP